MLIMKNKLDMVKKIFVVVCLAVWSMTSHAETLTFNLDDYRVDAVTSHTAEDALREEIEKAILSGTESEAAGSSETVGSEVVNKYEITAADLSSIRSMQEETHSWVASPKAVAKYGYYTPLREFEWSTVPLLTFGFIAKANKKNFRAARNNFIPAYENRFDDNLQLVPLVVASGLNFAGYQGRSKTWRYLVSGGMSFAWCALFVNTIKYSAKEMRPDGSTANSFPSGHTCTAFTAATIMHKEYGLTRSPWWSVFAYGCATTTGIMRTLNNRHWISDVLVGAGLGIISTDLGYMCADWIFKKKGINREPLVGNSDLWKNPSFFKLELGMQFTNNLKLPTRTEFLTTANLYNYGGSYLDDDYYTVQRRGNPFRIPDDFNAENREYKNYAAGSPAYAEGQAPLIKVGTGTTVAAEAAYFVNKYIGVGLRGRITTAPVTAEGLYTYTEKDDALVRNMNSASVSDVWSLVDINAGLYLAWPISPKHNLGMKALYGRRFFGSLNLVAAFDQLYLDTRTDATTSVTMYGDALKISKTNSDNLTLGLHYTYAMNSGMAISGFIDYDYSKPEFDVEYTPYHKELLNMVTKHSEFSFSHKVNSFTIGAAMSVIF